MFPNPLHSYIALAQYILVIGIFIIGIYQRVQLKNGISINKSYVIPLGATCLIFGFIGLLVSIKEAFRTIEAAGDISPQIVANSFSEAYDYPILGLFGLAFAYLFRFINSEMIIDNRT